MPSRFFVVFAAALVCAALVAAQQNTPPVRPARMSDLQGTWQMASASATASAEAGDAPAPYQIYFFDAEGRMKHMTARKPFTSLALFEAAPLVTRYTVDKRGTLILSNPSWDAPRKYLCSFVTRSTPGNDPKLPRVGDILLTGIDEGGKFVWSKLLRKTP